ncbi:hypothetical protein J2W35_004150 [Variovorax boronicumulans]|uniref:hypothetical protein n=1 Tax=Variovorax boronicumulans TaxID=436515 RepID=UPI0027811C2E|nr:hypothetical protein [Variovorax boronicumulans]MDQ0083784.1 hypothetical protein [Variovorax boronicumulans]
MTVPITPNPARPFTAFAAWLVDYCKQNPFKVLGTATLAFGSFLLIPVFWGIGELPQLDVASMLPLLGTIAVGGFVLTFFLVSMPIAGGLLARSKPTAPAWQSDWWAALIYVLPGICLSLLLWASMTWVSFWEGSAGYAAVILTALGPFLAAVRMWRLRRAVAGRMKAISEWATLAWNAVVLMVLSGYLVIMAIQIVAPESLTVGDLTATLALWTVYASAVTVLAVRIKSVEIIRVMLVVAFFVATILLLGTGGMTSISKMMLNKAGWGNYPAKLFVTDRGCDILNRSSGHVVCKTEKAAGGNLVCPVIVRSRIGTPNFFFVSSFTPSGNWPDRARALNVSLPKEDVIVSQRIAELKKSTQPIGTRDIQDPATHLVPQSGEQGKWMMSQCGNMPATILLKE